MRETMEYRRLKAVMSGDRAQKPAKFEEVLRSDLYAVLKNYFELDPEDVKIQCDAGESGVAFTVEGKARAVRPFLCLPL